jgi:hypothetical protein
VLADRDADRLAEVAESARTGSGVSVEEYEQGRKPFAKLLSIPPEVAAGRDRRGDRETPAAAADRLERQGARRPGPVHAGVVLEAHRPPRRAPHAAEVSGGDS